jgi:glutathione S-transferase
VILTRYLRARPAAVFHACTAPEVLARWLGPKAFEVCDVSSDARVGGAFAFSMTGEDGLYAARGVYRVIDPPRRVQLTWTWTAGPQTNWPEGLVSLLTFDFATEGHGTRLTLTHEGLPSQGHADSHSDGWSQALDKFERLFAE